MAKAVSRSVTMEDTLWNEVDARAMAVTGDRSSYIRKLVLADLARPAGEEAAKQEHLAAQLRYLASLPICPALIREKIVAALGEIRPEERAVIEAVEEAKARWGEPRAGPPPSPPGEQSEQSG